MSRIFQILDEIRNKVNEILRDNKSLILTVDIDIKQGGIRSWKFFKKAPIK